ncbi:hypothetical protein [Baekduia soli]|uniref:hypothetical protein n=1 Tax=Baekduia soli TaxID=496014 RepID=UPI001651F3C6|nr:hypothetical protein [Baekduia soli]
MLRTTLALILAAVASGLASSPALASVAAEQQAGGALAQQVRSGARTCGSLSAEDLDQVGEFAMGRAVGSTAAHEAMDARMTAVMGAAAESRMHQVLGAQYVGCATGTGGASTMMGGRGAMMGTGSGMWSWMAGSRWRAMSPADWQAVQQRVLGASAVHPRDAGWNSREAGLIAIAVAVAGVGAGLLLLRRRRRIRAAPRAPGAPRPARGT